MRIIGLILVMIGGLALGFHGFANVARERGEVAPAVGIAEDVLSVPPVMSGIAVVSGLILLASGGRRGED